MNRTYRPGSGGVSDITDGSIIDADVNASAAIALSKLATQAALTLVGNSTGGTAVPTALSVAATKTLLAYAVGDLASIATGRVVGNVSGSSAAPTVLTAAQVKTFLALANTDITGFGGAATLNVGTTAGTVAAGDDSRITGAAAKASNLSDLASASTARTNLGLGGAAVLNVGTAVSTVAAGDDSRFVRLASSSTTQVAASNTASETDLLSLAFLSGVTAGSVYELTAFGDSLNNTGSNANVRFRLYLGATNVGDTVQISAATSANRRRWFVRVQILVPTLSTQLFGGFIVYGTGNAANWITGVPIGALSSSSAEDLTSTKTLRLTVTLGSAAATLDAQLQAYTLVRI